MPQPLQPKKRSHNIDQMNRRLACSTRGWSVIPCEGKSFLPKRWTRMANAAVDIMAWDDPKMGFRPYAGTGVRIEGALFVIDLDITTASVGQAVVARIIARFPDLAGALRRSSGTSKLGLFLRIDRPVGYRRTARYGGGECVETFGSLVVRYFAIDGPHSVAGRFYTWDGGAPWDTDLDTLPIFKADDVGELIDICDDELGKHLPRVLNSMQAENTGAVIYDLEPGQTFITTEGEEVELSELEESLHPDLQRTGIRTRADWEASERKNHWKAILDSRGRLILMDFSENNTKHRWAADAPAKLAEVPADLAEALGQFSQAEEPESGTKDEPEAAAAPEPPASEPPMPSARSGFLVQLDWLLRSFAQTKAGQVVQIFEPSASCVQSMKAFDDYYAMFNELKPPPATGLNYATRIWRVHARRKSVLTHDMRPDMPFPLFQENGQTTKNSYLRERHEGDGEVETVLEFFRHLVPATAELGYFLDWLAHKWQCPWVPGHALIMVAANDTDGEQSGTGRGTLFKILERLFGRRYVRHLDFNILSGQSGQAVYTDWMADSLLVCVDESREGTGRYGERMSAYETLKPKCDPSARWMTVHPKGQPARDSLICCSYIIATNHADALLLPASDRRFAVLSNGDKLGDAAAARIYAWMDVPGNIAALSRWLQARDVSGFNAMGWPPMTVARERMMALSESEADRLVRDALWAMPGLVFTRRQLMLHIHNLSLDSDTLNNGNIQVQIAQVLRKRTVGLQVPGSKPRRERRFLVAGEGQVRGYVRSWSQAEKCDQMSNDEVRAEIAKNGLRAADDAAGTRVDQP